MPVLIAIIVINALLGLFVGVNWFGIIVGFTIGIGFSIPLQHAISTGEIHTMQDGRLTIKNKPLYYMGVFLILFVGYIFGILAPWLINA